jgi:hypothetical protein
MGGLREGKRDVANIIPCLVFPEIVEMNRQKDLQKESGT